VMLSAMEAKSGQLGKPTIEEGYKSATSVFIGKVISRRELYRDQKTGDLIERRPASYRGDHPEIYQYKIEVFRVFKGYHDKSLSVYTEVSSSDRQFLEVGEWSLIYAYLNEFHRTTYHKDRLFISADGHTRNLDETESRLMQEIISLEKLEKNNDR